MDNRGLTVFVVDDDPDIRSSLALALRLRDLEVVTYPSGPAFLAEYDPARAGCLVLDYGMPEMTGLEVQRQLNAMGSLLPIIFITGHGGVPESVQAIKGGAVDFLEKPFRQSVLVDRIQTAFDMLRGQIAMREGNRETRERFERLTLREQEIVRHMVEVPSETSSKEIGARLGISPRTVDHHRARILEKMHVRSVAELIALASRATVQ